MNSMRISCVMATVIALTCSLHASDTPSAAQNPPINFSRDILPILSDNCFSCHGPDEKSRKAKLRLDTREGAFRKEEPVLVPGKSADSVLFQRITSADEEEMMPPLKSKRKLNPQQVDSIKRWIDQGAVWGKHWAFEPPVRPELPSVNMKDWPRNSIDTFILARLEKEGMKPSATAPRHTLIRRVSLDLTGIPPTPEEVDAFVNDTAPDAYEKLVDRLFKSSRYGERMAWDWLDAARYADTNGYQGDNERTMWPWRDWVVKAMNDNKPYDKFTVEQLAGDLLPDATLEQRVATAFNRNHMINGEGGRIAAENRVDYVMDQSETAATIWLGVTMTCCRCHDHKYDQLSQKDYYSFFAFFNNTPVDGGGGNGQTAPVAEYSTPEQQTKLAALKAKEEEAKKAHDELEKTVRAAQADWERELIGGDSKPAEITWTPLILDEVYSDGGSTLTKNDDGTVIVSGKSPDKDSFVVVSKSLMRNITAFKLEALPDKSFVNNGPGRADNGNFVLSEIKLQGSGRPVDLGAVSADFEQQGWAVSGAVDGKSDTGWAVMPEFGKTHFAIFEARNQVGYGAPETTLSFRLEFQSPHKQHVLGKFRIYATNTNRSAIHPMPENLRSILALAPDKRSETQKTVLTQYYINNHPALLSATRARDDAKRAREQFEATLTRVMVMKENAKPRDTFVLIRGAYGKPSDKVSMNVPAALPPLPPEAPRNRLGLAQWLVSPNHPLTARVTVNHIWQSIFGIGLVKTAEDFGVQGEKPSHPELLDWLATEFVRTGWDVKALQRLIVTSATYQQSSKTNPESVERDPQNRLLARGARFRLPSWMLRDQALAASGLLVEKLGGPAVKPYQPPGIWEEATFGTISYKQDHGDSLYRRSLYIYWRRIVGPTMFFDTASRQQCTVKPSLTNTPLHALTTLNDVTYVEAARALAQRVMQQAPEPDSRINLAFKLMTAREPVPAERDILQKRLDLLRAQYKADSAASTRLLKTGESKRDEKLDPVEHAAYTGLCCLIMNLDEALTKE